MSRSFRPKSEAIPVRKPRQDRVRTRKAILGEAVSLTTRGPRRPEQRGAGQNYADPSTITRASGMIRVGLARYARNRRLLARLKRTPQRLDGTGPLASRHQGRNRLHQPHHSEEFTLRRVMNDRLVAVRLEDV